MAKEKSKGKAEAESQQAGAGAGGGSASTASTVPPRMHRRYREEIVPALMKEFGYANPMQVPRIQKVTLNFGLGEAVSNPNIVKTAVEELTSIAGQKAVITRSKKAIANFK